MSAPLVLCPLKNIPPNKNFVFCFIPFKKFVSKLEAEVDEVSFETLTWEPYFDVILLSIPFNKVESPDPIGITIGLAWEVYALTESYCEGKSSMKEICIKSKAKIMITIGKANSKIKLL